MANVTQLHINGTLRRIDVNPDRTLLSVLRDDLELTGSKYGCGEGQCGACTVLIDGLATRSCRKTIGTVGEAKIVTIEGLATHGKLHPVQQAFLDVNAMQCGYCTPGMIMAGVALLSTNPKPTQQEIVDAMDRNICRCGTYPRIIRAIQLAAETMNGGRP